MREFEYERRHTTILPASHRPEFYQDIVRIASVYGRACGHHQWQAEAREQW